ncbi:ABC transporter ATP-binding protein [Heyndrickxia coagulans]|uniref:ABC transporter ATP-binding protein n=1 Tax=Heyndrickxia coagulans TaxID=1398 RepID=UPI002E1DE686|nr:ABC transporter ATP-binding protein [Heyndrickxia coagulans]MED4964948.1 ABC transporter ATP-binding protein [Heyndrickxia coagulans]
MIQLINVSKKFKNNMVLKNITYSFEEGKIYGLFGKNGSGKTMLLRTIAGLIIPTEGQVKINDQILHEDISFPPSMGIIIENMELLPQYNAFTNLVILSKIKKVASPSDMKESIQRVGLDPSSNLKVKKYSLGMKQRLNIAQAIFEKPQIILLDEPTNAVDDDGVALIHKILIEEKERGATIIIASHLKEDIMPICDVSIRINNGVLMHE